MDKLRRDSHGWPAAWKIDKWSRYQATYKQCQLVSYPNMLRKVYIPGSNMNS